MRLDLAVTELELPCDLVDYRLGHFRRGRHVDDHGGDQEENALAWIGDPEIGRERPPGRTPEAEAVNDPGLSVALDLPSCYSHSIVEGGFDEMSSATRFTAGISLMILLEIVSSRS